MASFVPHGVNLTGWLTLEPWVTPELFADSGALDEASLISSVGTRRYAELVRRHRARFLGPSDFKQIAARGFNAVRLPVPWYVFGKKGPEPGPYVGCLRLVDDAMSWAEDIGLKVLLVLAISPGNTDEARLLVRDQVDFKEYRSDMLGVIRLLARRYALREGFLGIEVADEPHLQVRRGLTLTDGIATHTLRNYYRDAYEVIRQETGPDTLVVFPDGGKLMALRTFRAKDKYENVWLDCHLLHHTDSVDASGPSAVHKLVDKSLESLQVAAKTGIPTMVGKWSASLPFADAMMTPEGQIALARVYVSEQLAAFKKCPGWFFQTWKTSGRLVAWDARIALASFERRMLA